MTVWGWILVWVMVAFFWGAVFAWARERGKREEAESWARRYRTKTGKIVHSREEHDAENNRVPPKRQP